jgi:hypothetical protein
MTNTICMAKPVETLVKTSRLVSEMELAPRSMFQRFVAWLVRKSGLEYCRESRGIEFQEILFEPYKVLSSIKFSKEDLRRIYHRHTDRIVCSPRLLFELQVAESIYEPFSIPAQMELEGEDGSRILGMTVEVVPWVFGWVLLPSRDDVPDRV